MAIETKKLTEVDVLDTATEQTKVLVVENGTTMQLPASSLGGGGGNGVTIAIDSSNDAYDFGEYHSFEDWGYDDDGNKRTPYKVGTYVFFARGSKLYKILTAEDNDDLHLYDVELVWSIPKQLPRVMEFNFDMCATLDEQIALLNEETPGAYDGEIILINDIEYAGKNSGAAIWIPDGSGYGKWMKITA